MNSWPPTEEPSENPPRPMDDPPLPEPQEPNPSEAPEPTYNPEE